MKKFYKSNNFLSIVASMLVSVLFVAASVQGATTISTNIETAGTLSVTSTSALTGAVTITGDIIADTDTLYVDVSADRVGVGTTTPSAMFSVGEGTGTVTGDAYFTGGLTIGAEAAINGVDGTIVFSGKAADPTGAAGMVYYDSTNKSLKLHDGEFWFTVGTTTTGIQLSAPRVSLGDLTTQYMTIGTTTQEGLSILTLSATTTTSIPLSIMGEESSTANYMQIIDSEAAEIFAIDNNANASTTGIWAFTGDVWFNGYATTTIANGNFATDGSLTVGEDDEGTDVTFYTDTAGEELLWDASANALLFDGMATTTVTTGNIETEGTVTAASLATLGGGQLRSYANSTSTTDTTYTLIEADLLNYDTMIMVLNVDSATFTLPATSTLTSMVPTTGDMQELCIHNATTTDGIDLTFAAGAGIDLETSSSTPVDLTIEDGAFGCFKFIRQLDRAGGGGGDVSVLLTIFNDAD
ncbi:hypothetical protein ACFLZC_00675 [Patescibacteria group bacterium]